MAENTGSKFYTVLLKFAFLLFNLGVFVRFRLNLTEFVVFGEKGESKSISLVRVRELLRNRSDFLLDCSSEFEAFL